MKIICVFCAASNSIPQIYFDEARELTRLLVEAGHTIVYGGGHVGLMGAVADAALEQGGNIIGVIPKFMNDIELQHPHVKDMRLTTSMSERKQLLMQLSDAIVALPGSTGTLDELFEALTERKLNIHRKPIVLLNTNHFYDHMIAQLQLMVDDHFMNKSHLDQLAIANAPAEVLKLI